MNTKSSLRKESQNKITKISERLKTKDINKIAKISGFRKRKSGKIDARGLVIGFMLMMSKKKNTYDSWSQAVSVLANKVISRQAIEERMNEETGLMTKMLLENELKKNIETRSSLNNDKVLGLFNSIMIEDSTTLRLPEELSNIFPGNVSKGKKRSLAKIHAMFNYCKNDFEFMDTHSFAENDQSLSPRVLSSLKRGDLLLRDMGFLVLDVLKNLDEKGIYFISRKASKINVYNVATGNEINLVKTLRKTGFFDDVVFVGKKSMIKTRLVIIKIPQEQAAERRRKARKDRDQRLNHNKDYYELLGYSIFITNIATDQCTPERIKKLYGLRWQIEIIFKSWKSCFSMENLIPAKCKNPERIHCTINLILLFILLFHVVWINNHKHCGRNNTQISLLKMARFFIENFQLILYHLNEEIINDLIQSKCKYDKRFDRLNLSQKYENIAA